MALKSKENSGKPKIKKRRPVKKRRDREDSKRRLIEAAVQVFSRIGYDAATTRLIAREADLNESLIQRYFESKAGLLIAVISHFVEQDDLAPVPYPRGKTVREEIENFFSWRLAHDLEKQSFMRVVVSRAILDPQVGAEMAKHTCEGGMPGLWAHLKELQTEGKIRPEVNVEKISMTLSALAFSLAFMAQIVFQHDRDYIRGLCADTAETYANVIGI